MQTMPSRGDKNKPSGRIHLHQRDAAPIIGGGNTITAEQRGSLVYTSCLIFYLIFNNPSVFESLGRHRGGCMTKNRLRKAIGAWANNWSVYTSDFGRIGEQI
jgi:hypothetical protein